MDKLEDEWSASDDARTSREEVTADDASETKSTHIVERNQQIPYVSKTLDFPADWLPTFGSKDCQKYAGHRKKTLLTTAICGMSSSPPTANI